MNCNAGMVQQHDQPQPVDLQHRLYFPTATHFPFCSRLFISFHNLKFTLCTLLSEKYISYKKNNIVSFFCEIFLF